jgi:hypothetical protein
MKTTIYLKLISLSVILCFCLMSCDKFVDIDTPIDKVATKSVFNSDETAVAATLNLYIMMNASSTAIPYYISATGGMYTDELKSYSTTESVRSVYLNGLTSVNGPFLNIWKTGYNMIYQSNAVIEGCEQSKVITPSISKQLTAESLLMRAYWHLLLSNFYGDIPVVTSTDHQISSVAKKLPVSEVYKQVISDLLIAERDLSIEYLNGDTKTPISERIRPNKYAAMALLARVYLYDKQFSQAELYASKVIDNKALYSLPTTDKVFLKGSSEAIWQLARPIPNAATLNTYEAFYYTLTSKPSAGITNSITITDDLLNAFELSDLRKTLWLGKFKDATGEYNFPNKYKSKSTSLVEENTIVLRLAEQYLIRSEARAMINSFAGARDDLNAIRRRASLDDNLANDQIALINAILKERRIEFFSEWGYRLIDLNRTNKLDGVMNAYANQKGATWQSFKKYLPIPQRELDNNPNLKQNDGYN